MGDYKSKTKDELLEIIQQLEKQLTIQSASLSSCCNENPGRFREKYYREILNAFPDMITVSDYDANFVELVSAPHTNHVEGVSNEELLRSNLKDVVPDEAYRHIRSNMDKVISSGKANIAEHSLIFQGKLHHYENRICPLGDSYLLCMCRDVTDRAEAEKELIAARVKAEEANRLKSAFFANMSHEIRTPLNAIVGFSRLVVDSGDEEEKKDYCDIIEKNSNLLLNLFNDILDLSSLEAGAVEFTKEKVNLFSICRREYKKYRDKTASGVLMKLDEVDEDLCIMGDELHIAQVLTNLLSNAVKFTLSGEIHIGFQRKGGTIQFYVRDSGSGIPANRVATIFERFGKLNDFAQGTGLGLTLCRMLVERMGGRIWVRSGVGLGTTFYFTLPTE